MLRGRNEEGGRDRRLQIDVAAGRGEGCSKLRKRISESGRSKILAPLVTSAGELVWEYVNPYFGEGPNGLNNRVFRAYRYSTDEIAKAKAKGGTQ